ncbi:MAG TPA: hypothetical protein VGI39_46500 [Polyangiaceae bacterium]|jgi:hypothetical protein
MKTHGAKDRMEAAGRRGRIEATAVTGALAGAAAGSLAGPPGIAAGAVLGVAAGALTGLALADEAGRLYEKEARLDREIGVTKGDLGAARPDQPRAKRGTYSGVSAGTDARETPAPSEGPMQELDE